MITKPGQQISYDSFSIHSLSSVEGRLRSVERGVSNAPSWFANTCFFIYGAARSRALSNMDLHGKSIIGGTISARGTATFSAHNPTNRESLAPLFHEATADEIEQSLDLAERDFEIYRREPPERVAEFLDRIGEEIIRMGDELLHRANAETGLPAQRLTAERARTVGQLAMFAALVREGSWVDASIDRALPERKPVPKPDLRRTLVPIGPVVVFAASNFPLAFSVVGGDTASALAAGNPVVVKAHPGHPGTSELLARAVQTAAETSQMPAGVFS